MISADTIVALSTGTLPSGVAIVRLSGPKSIELIGNYVRSLPEPRVLARRDIVDPQNGVVFDQAMVVIFPAPHSFTGEDCAELHLHGSVAVINAVLKSLSTKDDVRLAQAGEFTRRAFENGRLDLTEVEGLSDLLEAETESQRVLALARLNGQWARQSTAWRETLLNCLVELEAQLDFSDEEDVQLGASTLFMDRLLKLKGELENTQSTYGSGRIVREGFRIGLAGSPNAGKSSLFNYLAQSDLAIVTAEPGTTRDLKEVQINLNGQLVTLIDSAGLRVSSSIAEQEGIQRARDMMFSCDLILWLRAPDAEETEGPPKGLAHLVLVGTKSDLLATTDSGVQISIRSKDGVKPLMQVIQKRVTAHTNTDGPLLISRLRDLEAVQKCLVLVTHALQSHQDLELVCEDLRLAARELERWVGVVDSEQILDRLFAGFCIGK